MFAGPDASDRVTAGLGLRQHRLQDISHQPCHGSTHSTPALPTLPPHPGPPPRGTPAVCLLQQTRRRGTQGPIPQRGRFGFVVSFGNCTLNPCHLHTFFSLSFVESLRTTMEVREIKQVMNVASWSHWVQSRLGQTTRMLTFAAQTTPMLPQCLARARVNEVLWAHQGYDCRNQRRHSNRNSRRTDEEIRVGHS